MALWAALGIALMFALALVAEVNWAELRTGLARLGWHVWLLLMVAQAAIIGAGALKWRLILREVSPDKLTLSLRVAVSATTVGALLGQVLPIQIITPASRAWVARRYRIPALRAIGSSLYEQLFDLIALASVGAVSLFIASLELPLALSLILALALLLALLAVIAPTMRSAAKISTILAKGRWKRTAATLAEGFATAARLPRRLLAALASLSLVRVALLGALNVGLLAVLLPDIALIVTIAAFPLVLLVMTLPILPGGLGITEVTWSGVLVIAGAQAEEAVEAALLLRIATTTAFLAVTPALLAGDLWRRN